jgi:hypothetical protein
VGRKNSIINRIVLPTSIFSIPTLVFVIRVGKANIFIF